jgi:hypothetical protein
MYSQIVGKIRMALTPLESQWANVPFYVTPRGLTTSAILFGERIFAIDFDFIAHQVDITVSDGRSRSVALVPAKSVANFYDELMSGLRALDIAVTIMPTAVEVPDPVNLAEDTVHATYDPEYVNRFWRILVQADAALKLHRAPFRGRHTQVQFFWGTFDLAYARFSGRPATPPKKDVIMRVAMDAEEICAGFWAGDGRFPEPAFWCYAYPKPAGLENATIGPSAAGWDAGMGEFILRYEDVRTSSAPRETLGEFFRSTFEAGARLAKWDEAGVTAPRSAP